MAYLPKGTYKIPLFDGGLNTKWTDITCPPHMSPALLNVDFADVGSVKNANGYALLNSGAAGSSVVDGIHALYAGSTGAECLLAVCSGSVYVTTATALTAISGATGIYTSGVNVCIRTVEEQAYFTNGYTTPHRYDGTAFYTVGVSAYASGVTAAGVVSSGVGSLTSGGQYIYALSGENTAAVEGNYAVITSTLTAADGGRITLSNVPVYPSSAGVNQKYLYRNTAGAAGIYYRVTALTAAQTGYTDVAADSALVTLGQTDHNPPPHCKFWWYHRGRMFAAGDPSYPERVYHSEGGQPQIWPLANSLDIGKGDGLPITGIRVLGNSLIVHKANADGSQASIWLVYMPESTDATDSTNWYVIKSPSAYAARSDKAIAFFENMIAFLDKRGLFAFTGENIAPGPATSQAGQYLAEARSANIDPDIGDLKSSLLSGAALFDFDSKLWLAVPSSSATTGNDVIYVYDYSTASQQRGLGAWSKRSAPAVNCFTLFKGELVAGDAAAGRIWRMDTGLTQNGTAQQCYFYTIDIAGQQPHWEHTKVWRYLWLTLDAIGACQLTVTWWCEKASNETGSTTVDMSGGAPTWDNAQWDVATWDAGTGRKTIKIGLGGAVGRTIQFRFKTESAVAQWAINRLELQYDLRGRRG